MSLNLTPRSVLALQSGLQSGLRSAVGSAVGAVAGAAAGAAGALVGRVTAAAQQLPASAGAIAARAVAGSLSASQVQQARQLLQLGDFVGGLLGLGVDVTTQPQALLGGMTLADAQRIHQQMRDAQVARRNLYFIRVTDHNPPDGSTGAAMLNLFAQDASYAPNTLTAEKVPIGAAVMDRPSGTEPIELSITTLDDSVGTLKRWFDGKFGQIAHADGTFGLPAEYWVDFEIFHAAPFARPDAYKVAMRMRANSIQHEVSRRAPELAEITMTWSQCDTFIAPL